MYRVNQKLAPVRGPPYFYYIYILHPGNNIKGLFWAFTCFKPGYKKRKKGCILA